MSVDKIVDLKYGKMGILESSIRVDGCTQTAYLGEGFKIEDLNPMFVPTLADFLNAAYVRGRADEAERRSQMLNSLLSKRYK